MKEKIINLLDQTIEELDKAKISEILEIPPKKIWEIMHFLAFSLQKYFVRLRI